MTVMELGSEILKVDEVGRVRTPPETRGDAWRVQSQRDDRGAVREIRRGEVFDADVLATEATQGSRAE